MHAFIRNISKFNTFAKLYFWFPFFILVCPTFPSHISIGNQLVFVLTVLGLGLLLVFGSYRIKYSDGFILYAGYFLLISIWDVTVEMLKNNIAPNDFLEVLRPIGFILTFQYYRYSTIKQEIVENKTIIMFYWTFSILAVYCILEFMLPEQFRPISFLLWKRAELGILHNKAVASFFQTYNSAYAFMLPYFMGLLVLIKKFSIKNLLFYFLMLATLLLTQSKSMYVCVAIGTVLCVLLSIDFNSIKSVFKITTFIVGFVLIVGVLYIAFEEDITKNLQYAFTGFEAMQRGESGSMNARSSQIDWAIDNNLIGVVGMGIGKGEILLESVYALYYYRYGIIGIMLLFSVIAYTARCAYINCRKLTGITRILYLAIFVFMCIHPIALTSSCHHDMPKTSLIFYGMIGLTLRRYHLLTSTRPQQNTHLTTTSSA